MRKIDRASVISPRCLGAYQHGRDPWSVDPTHRLSQPLKQCKTELSHALRQMQSGLCAYCEGSLERAGEPHIEHFRQRSDFPKLTFVWENLFLSCSDKETCGKHKDHKSKGTYAQGDPDNPYNRGDLLKPCEDDPHHFLSFSTDGEVEPCEGLSSTEEQRAQTTIRVFNLFHPRLVSQRKQVAETYLAVESGLVEALEEMSEEERRFFITEALREEEVKPFSSSVCHMLCGLL